MLEIDGNPAGAIYLDRGRITFARASWIPDLTARLIFSLRLSAELQKNLPGGDQPDRDIGAMLLQHGLATLDKLQAILRSAVVDAVIALTVPLATDSFVSDIRFQVPGTHWAGSYSRLPVDSVQAEAVSRAERMVRYGLTHTTPVQLQDMELASAVLTPEQWAVACQINGMLSAQDLAGRCGLALYETIECVGELTRAGMCAPSPVRLPAAPLPRRAGQPAGPPVRAPQAARPPLPRSTSWRDPVPASAGTPPPAPWSSAPGSVPVALPAPLPAPLPGPRRSGPATSASPEPSAGASPQPGDAEFMPPAPELLRRVLDGLRKLG